jgi:hypothetical protein
MVVLLAIAGCAAEAPPPEPPFYEIVTSDAELMKGIIDPNAFAVFDAVGAIVDADGIHEFEPATDEEWEMVADRALGLAEASNLLLMPERAQGRQSWIEQSEMMRERAIRASETALLQDAERLLEAGGELFEACQNCHDEYIIDPDSPAPLP